MGKKPVVLHPFLFAVYPILLLRSINADITVLGEVVKLIAVVLAATAVLFEIAAGILRDRKKAGVVSSVLLTLFFSYGHVYNIISVFALGYHSPVVHRYLLTAYAVLFAACSYAIARTGRDLKGLTMILNLVGALAVAAPLVKIIAYGMGSDTFVSGGMHEPDSGVRKPAGAEGMPDIYYIILDSYASSSTLKDFYGFDNQEFTDYLKGRGFIITNGSHSNYAWTFLSLASSLNMQYLDALEDREGAKPLDRTPAYLMIRHNKVARILKAKGYKTVHFSSGYGETDYNDEADLYVKCGLDEFTSTLLETTMLNPLDLKLKREAVLCSLSGLPEARNRIGGPRFVFAHINMPHPPYLFDAKGSPVRYEDMRIDKDLWEYKNLYVGQLMYTNDRMRQVIDRILDESDAPPIIILQSDHGPAAEGRLDKPNLSFLAERMGILNAYYLPGNGSGMPYDSITPVNTFRLVLDSYFNESYALLEDKSFISDYAHPYRFVEVTCNLTDCGIDHTLSRRT